MKQCHKFVSNYIVEPFMVAFSLGYAILSICKQEQMGPYFVYFLPAIAYKEFGDLQSENYQNQILILTLAYLILQAISDYLHSKLLIIFVVLLALWIMWLFLNFVSLKIEKFKKPEANISYGLFLFVSIFLDEKGYINSESEKTMVKVGSLILFLVSYYLINKGTLESDYFLWLYYRKKN